MRIYSEIAKRLREMIATGHDVVSKSNLIEGLDVSSMPREDLERKYISAAASCVLYAHDFRSPVRGSGVYVAYKNVNDPLVLHSMVENSNADANQKTAILSALRKLADNSLEEHPEYAQMYFDVDENGDLTFKEGFTKQELLEMLLADVEAV